MDGTKFESLNSDIEDCSKQYGPKFEGYICIKPKYFL